MRTFELFCAYSDKEIAEKKIAVADEVRFREKISDEKKTANEGYNDTLKESDARIRDLLKQITDGGEMRLVEVREELNTPARGQKTLFRVDTGEAVDVEPMELFDQGEVANG